MSEGSVERPSIRRRPGRVHIYGAGVAGLTAAHELAVRGFRVRIYEPAIEYNEQGQFEGRVFRQAQRKMAVGGMARTQYVRVAKGAPGNFPGEGQFTTCDDYRLVYRYPQDFKDWEDIDPKDHLADYVTRCGFFGDTSPGILHIRAPAPSASLSPEEQERRRARRALAAQSARTFLSRLEVPEGVTSPFLAEDRIVIVGRKEEKWGEGLDGPFPDLEDEDVLHLEVLQFLPGEHGFRFFPSYYRNLFSTMVETPILDEQGKPTGRRVFDNLEPSSFYGIAAQGRRIRFIRRAPISRPIEMLDGLRELASSGYSATDMLQFTLRMWRYMCTSSERRKAEYERITWWEYLEGYDPKTGSRRYQYTDAFKKDMQFAPRVMAAFDGAWGDARTNGNTLVQLYLNNVLPLPKTDGTLNGPTTLAWLRPWRRFLQEYLGVEFRPNRVTRITLDPAAGRIIPFLTEEKRDLEGETESGEPRPVDYYIVATDAVAAEQVTEELPRVGVLEKLHGFTRVIPRNPRGPEGAQERRPDALPGSVPWDRFQTLTGIQFFFPSTVRLAEGYIYFLDALWGLSAINSHQYWATPPTYSEHGFGSLLSVDIGNWYVDEPGKPSPSRASRHALAHEVWRQIREATEQHAAPLPQATDFGFRLPEPAWYHVDRNILYWTDERTQQQRPSRNHTPYLIPIVGDWDNRPGTEPWDPQAPSSPPPPGASPSRDVWQAPHGGYPVHWGQLVFAGTYLKTFTRMTTMESANESARHAVNAIIDHYLAHTKPEEVQQRGGPGLRAQPPVMPAYSGQGSLTGSPSFRMTPIGEYCRIWNPEQYELPELAPLRELDAKLLAAGLPHVWDVLHLEPLALPFLGTSAPSQGAEALKNFLAQAGLTR